MERSFTYEVKRELHMSPYAEAQKTCNKLRNEYADKNLEIFLKNPGKEKLVPTNSTTSAFIANKIGFEGLIEVVVKGDLSEEILKQCADKVGAIFELENAPPSTMEILTRRIDSSK